MRACVRQTLAGQAKMLVVAALGESVAWCEAVGRRSPAARRTACYIPASVERMAAPVSPRFGVMRNKRAS